MRHKNAVQILFHFMRKDFENYRNVIRIGVKVVSSHKLISLSQPTVYLTNSNVFLIKMLWFYKNQFYDTLIFFITPSNLCICAIPFFDIWYILNIVSILFLISLNWYIIKPFNDMLTLLWGLIGVIISTKFNDKIWG